MTSKRPSNSIQISILRQLAHGHKLRFSEINADNYSSDQLAYHLRELVKNLLVSKDAAGLYQLTEAGSGLTLDLDKNMKQYIQRGIIGSLAIITKTVESEEYILLQRRTRHPNIGKLVLPGGQVLFGEQTNHAVKRVVNIETGLDATYTLLGLQHILSEEPGEPPQDLYFFIYLAHSVEGEPEKDGPNGENIWMQINKLPTESATLFLEEIIAMRSNSACTIEERS